jgi:hypothetical protein
MNARAHDAKCEVRGHVQVIDHWRPQDWRHQ